MIATDLNTGHLRSSVKSPCAMYLMQTKLTSFLFSVVKGNTYCGRNSSKEHFMVLLTASDTNLAICSTSKTCTNPFSLLHIKKAGMTSDLLCDWFDKVNINM